MQVTVRVGDPLWRKLGRRRLVVDCKANEVSAAQVLAQLAAAYPEAAADILPDGTSVAERLPYHLFVNHRKVPWDQADRVWLRDGDELVLFLVVVGG